MNRITSIVMFAAGVLLLFFAVQGDHGLMRLKELEGEQASLEQKNRKLESDITSLQNKVYGMRQDPAFLEKTARQQLGLSKPGEIVYIFPHSEK